MLADVPSSTRGCLLEALFDGANLGEQIYERLAMASLRDIVVAIPVNSGLYEEGIGPILSKAILRVVTIMEEQI